jgi:hypothetical protein
VRLVDAVLRQGHLSEQALTEALMTGERPQHLDRCDLCAERAVELGRWLDDVRLLGQEAADQVFTPERLAAQHAQILRKMEQADEPPRVISFPAASAREVRESMGRRVAPAWVGVAAAAGLVLGVVGGQVSARLSMPPILTNAQQTPPATTVPAAPTSETAAADTDPAVSTPANTAAFDEDLLTEAPRSLRILDELTPRFRTTSNSGG